MGMWDFEAWDNDSAADWFAGLMDETKLRDKWLKAINDEDSGQEARRAAVWLFAQLGRVYIWPISNYDEDLELAITVGEEIAASKGLIDEVPPFIEKLKLDIEEIKKRRK